MSILIQVKKLRRYHQTPQQQIRAVDGVSFDVEKGAFVSIVGASGSGKSTLLSILAGLDTCDEGEIWYQQEPIHRYNEEQKARFRRKNIGFVFQSFQLFDTCTAIENVHLPLEMQGEENIEKATRLLHDVGLGDRLHHYPQQLSGGEQQRVALARAFATAPPLLLADEPTGNLDTRTGERVMDIFFSLREHFQSTVIMVTHDSKMAERADVMYRMDAGKIEREK